MIRGSKRQATILVEEIVSTIRNNGEYVGEQDSSELAEALLNPETRNVAQLVVEDKQKTENLIEILMGPNVPPRRAYLLKHIEEANEND